MKSDKPENFFLKIVKSAWQLEWGSTEGRYNVFFTSMIMFFVFSYGVSDVIKIGIYAFAFGEKYETLTLGETLIHPIIWGGLCFLFMILRSLDIIKFKNKIKNKEEEAKAETASTVNDETFDKPKE